MHLDGPPILWVSGPCGVGKSDLILRFTAMLQKQGYPNCWLELERFSRGGDLASAYAEFSRTKMTFLIFDGLEFLPGATTLLQDQILPAISARWRVIIIARRPPLGPWLAPWWQQLVRQVAVRPLGVIEAEAALPEGSGGGEIVQAYSSAGGRYALLKGDQLAQPDELIARYLQEFQAKVYFDKLKAAAHTWRFDRQLLEEVAGELTRNDWRELVDCSFVYSAHDGFYIDPVLQKVMLAEKQTMVSWIAYSHLLVRAEQSNYPSLFLVLNLLGLQQLNGLDELLDYRLPFTWSSSTPVPAGDLRATLNMLPMVCNFAPDWENAGGSNSEVDVYLLRDPSSCIVGLLALIGTAVAEPAVVVATGFYPGFERMIAGMVGRKLLALAIAGQRVLIPGAFGLLVELFSRLKFPEVSIRTVEYTGKALLCDFTSQGLLPWLRRLRPGQKVTKVSSKPKPAEIRAEWLRVALRRFNDDNRLLETELGKYLGRASAGIMAGRQGVETIRTIIRHALAKLPPEQARLLTTAYMTLGTRTELGRELGLSQRSLYRKLQASLQLLGEIIAGGLEGSEAVRRKDPWKH